MDKNRRRFLRKVPDELTVIQIERDEVGRVLNVSEGGLSFSSVTPVPRNLPVYFWFSFNLKDRIEAMGEVTWTDTSRTVGGLRFTKLSQANREQIKKWLARLRTDQVRGREEVEIVLEDPDREEVPKKQNAGVARLVLADERVATRANEPVPIRQTRTSDPVQTRSSESHTNGLDRVARFVSKARAYRPILSFGGGSTADAKEAPLVQPPSLGIEPPKLENEPPKTRPYCSMFSLDVGPAKGSESGESKFSSLSFKGIESLVELVPLQRYLSAKKRQLLCGVLLGVGLSIAVMVPVMKFSNSRAQADIKAVAAASESPKTNSNEVPVHAPLTTPTETIHNKPSYPVAGIFSDPLSLKNIPLKKGTTTPILSARSAPSDFYRQDLPKTVAKATKQTPGAPSGMPSSNASLASTKSGMNPTQLWGEVQAGNSKAAVELAELYIKGEGVPQNCQQARVLLLVASEKRNTAAIKRLQELDKGAACP